MLEPVWPASWTPLPQLALVGSVGWMQHAEIVRVAQEAGGLRPCEEACTVHDARKSCCGVRCLISSLLIGVHEACKATAL